MNTKVPIADACARGAGRGALGGLIASVPVFGPALASLCAACVGGGAAVAGVGIGLARWPFDGNPSGRRGDRACYLVLMNLALVPAARIAARELSTMPSRTEVTW